MSILDTDQNKSLLLFDQNEERPLDGIPNDAIQTITDTIEQYKNLMQSLDKSDPSKLVYQEIIVSLKAKLQELNGEEKISDEENTDWNKIFTNSETSPRKRLEIINDNTRQYDEDRWIEDISPIQNEIRHFEQLDQHVDVQLNEGYSQQQAYDNTSLQEVGPTGNYWNFITTLLSIFYRIQARWNQWFIIWESIKRHLQ